ncbi:MAG: transcription elongation factor GreA [Lactobacillales bacterium]|jgi:transcription elongation factor GreA|nr:transcription elongation factor GreA [Lactobacillales bacterium]
MAEEKKYEMTAEGLEKVKAELHELTHVKRPEVIERIQIARGFGDLSENSEYDAAKDEQAHVEQRIKDLEIIIDNAVIADSSSVAADEISIGKIVTIQEKGEDEEVYMIVGGAEADPFTEPARISNESPIGRALLGKKKGESATIESPAGSYTVKIKKVK